MPPESQTSQHISLFNRSEFHQLNLSGELRVARFDHRRDGKLIGSLCGMVNGTELVSGYSAPLGGPDLVRQSETVTNVMSLLRDALDQARGEGITTVRVKAKPDFYSGSEVEVQFALLNVGFAVESTELNFHFDLAGVTAVEDYVARLKPPARRALKHASGEPFTFAEAASDEEWTVAYGILDRNRQAKGRRLRLSLEYVLRARDTFPGHIRMFTLVHGDRACAAALVYKVRPQRDMVVAWGDADHELPRSPMNVLVHQLMAQELGDGVLTVDLGISSVDGAPDQGLIQFKESVGAKSSLRLDLVTHL